MLVMFNNTCFVKSFWAVTAGVGATILLKELYKEANEVSAQQSDRVGEITTCTIQTVPAA